MIARRSRMAAGAVAGALALAVTGAGSVSAQSTPALQIREVGPGDAGTDAAVYFATGEGGSSPTITVNGGSVDVVKAAALPSSTPVGNALVFDTSTPMDQSGPSPRPRTRPCAWITSCDR